MLACQAKMGPSPTAVKIEALALRGRPRVRDNHASRGKRGGLTNDAQLISQLFLN